MQREYFVYLYKDRRTNKYIYIGIATGQRGIELNARIKAHAEDVSFASYIPYVEILLWEVTNKAEARGLELLLINEYKPVLNKADKYESKIKCPLLLPDTFLTYQDYLNRCAKENKNTDKKWHQTFYSTKYKKVIEEWEQTKRRYDEVEKFLEFIKNNKTTDKSLLEYKCNYGGLGGLTIKTQNVCISVFSKGKKVRDEYIYIIEKNLIPAILKHVPQQIRSEFLESCRKRIEFETKYQSFSPTKINDTK